MLPKLSKLPACTWNRFSRGAGSMRFVAPTVAALIATAGVAVAQTSTGETRNGTGLTNQVATPASVGSVVTYHNNEQRTGVNSNETAFVPNGASANMSAQKFGKIWSRILDGTVYTQPLYVPAVQFPNVPDVLNSTTTNGVYNAVFVCTTHNSIYAFDGGGSAPLTHPGSTSAAVRAAPLWRVNFNFPNAQIGPVPLSDIFSEDLTPEIGIVGTPVIYCVTNTVTGRNSGTLFVVAKTKEGSGYAQHLHAIDIATGKERIDLGSPLLIQASVLGTGDGAILDQNNGFKPTVFFDPQWENQQAALTFHGGSLFVAWGSHGDNGPYHGWVMQFAVSPRMKLVNAFNTTPNGDSSTLSFPAGGGIWQGGAGPSVDQNGALFLATGTGQFGGTEFGQSVLKLQFYTSPAKPLVDFFTPYNWQPLSDNLLDLGSGGVVVLPAVGNVKTPRLAAAAGTEGTIYLINRDTGSMGHFTQGSDNVVQSITDAVGPVFGLPAFFNNKLYYQGTSDLMKAYQFQAGLLNPVPVSQSTRSFDFPGATPVVTSSPNGSNGVVWAVERFTPTAILPGLGIPDPTPYSVLHGFDAADLTHEVYPGLAMGSRDLSSSAVYTPPTVANGRAYVGGVSELAAYGFFAANGMSPGSAQADHFIVTGPDSVAQSTGNWYSLTAIGPDGNPVKLNGTVHLSYRTFGGPTVNITSLLFNNTSNVLFQYAFMNSSLYEFFANDDFGHSTYVENIDMMPFGTLFPEIFVNTPEANGPDHLIVRAPLTARVGSKFSVSITTVTPNNGPFTWQLNGASAMVSNVFTQFTLPDGTQGSSPGFPGYAYSSGPGVQFTTGSSTATIQLSVPSVGNHVLIVSGFVTFLFGPPANPTSSFSYSVSGTAAIVGTP